MKIVGFFILLLLFTVHNLKKKKSIVGVIIHSLYPVLEFTIECKLILRFPIWYFVHSKPVHCGFQVSWLKPPYILNICKKWWHAARAGNWVPGKFRLKFLQKLTIKVCSFRILNINHNHFPVCFFFIYQCKNSQHFHPDDFSTWADLQKWVGGILGDRNVRKIFKGKLAKNHLLTHLA